MQNLKYDTKQTDKCKMWCFVNMIHIFNRNNHLPYQPTAAFADYTTDKKHKRNKKALNPRFTIATGHQKHYHKRNQRVKIHLICKLRLQSNDSSQYTCYKRHSQCINIFPMK